MHELDRPYDRERDPDEVATEDVDVDIRVLNSGRKYLEEAAA